MNGALNFSNSKYDFQKDGYWHNHRLGAILTESVVLPFMFTVRIPDTTGSVEISSFTLLKVTVNGDEIQEVEEFTQDEGILTINRSGEVAIVSFSGSLIYPEQGVYQYKVTISEAGGGEYFSKVMKSEPFIVCMDIETVGGGEFTSEFTMEFT